jgi:HEAT repeat protein
VAVPPGTYEAVASIDLGGLLGRVEHRQEINIEAPPPGLLDRELQALTSKDADARRAAIYELYWYTREAKRVVPVLLACLDDPDVYIRAGALYSLEAFPVEAAQHTKRFLKILHGGPRVNPENRLSAARLLAATAERDDGVMAALEALAKSEDERQRQHGRYALEEYRRRHADKTDPESGR